MTPSSSLVNQACSDLRPHLLDAVASIERGRDMRVPTDVGRLWLHADDQVMTPWVVHHGAWEAAEAATLRALLGPGMNVVDVGANVGYFSLLCARAVGPVGRVVALEPEPANYALLCANLWDSAVENVEPIRAAASSYTGTTPLSFSESNRGDHRAFARSSAAHVTEVPCVRLDDLLRPDAEVHVAKIDVQGTDHLVVLGMEGIIARCRPTLLVEFWPGGIEEYGDRPIDVLSYYRSLGLAVALLEEGAVERPASDDGALVEAVAAARGGFGTLLLRPQASLPHRSVPTPASAGPAIEVLDLFGLPSRGGAVTAQCRWRIGAELADRAGADPLHLASRVRDASGTLVLDNGPRSRPVSAAEPEHRLFVPLAIPTRPGVYEVEIDPVVEHKFWASWFGQPPTILRVERLPNGGLLAADPRTDRRFHVGRPAPSRAGPFRIPHPLYGADDSERAVEIPWVLSRYRGERRVLDVGYAYAEPRYLEALGELEIPFLVGLDLAPARQSGFRGVVADARHPGFRPGSFDLVIAISVVEHIGRNNARYLGDGRPDPRGDDGDLAAIRALAALLAPGGRLLLTVPFGVAEDHGWFIQYDAARLEMLVEASGLAPVEAEFYRYEEAWRGPCPPRDLADCRYGRGAVAATGLACLALERPPSRLARLRRRLGRYRSALAPARGRRGA